MDNLDSKEKVWGGVFGGITIISAIAEMIFGGLDAASVAGMIKDVSSTLVVVVVLIVFLKSLPKKMKKMDDILENVVETWGRDNIPFIFKIEGYEKSQDSNYVQGFCLLQDTGEYISLATTLKVDSDEQMKKYASYRSKHTGKFIDMPSYKDMVSADFDVTFSLETKHFLEIENMGEYIDNIIKAVSIRMNYIVGVERIGKASLRFKVKFKRIETKEAADSFVEVMDFILSLVKVIA